MSAFAKTITPSLATKLPCNAHRSIPAPAGEAIAAGDACYLKSDGTVWRSNGAAATAPAQVDGFAAMDYVVGQNLTLYHGVHLAYGPANATPGTKLFLSGTVAGGLDTVASTGGTAYVATVEYVTTKESVNHAVIYVKKSGY